MNSKLVRGLLAGASLAGMVVGAAAVAQAAGVTVNGPQGGVFNPAAGTLDFIEVTPTGVITEPGAGIENAGLVLGDISNAGDINANYTALGGSTVGAAGILSYGTVDGDIVNTNDIIVGGLAGGPGETNVLAAGIISFETGDTGQAVINDGLIDVNAIGTADNNFAGALGVAVIGTSAAGYDALLDNNGDLFVDAVAVDDTNSNAVAAIAVGGVAGAFADGPASAVVDNSGTMDVNALATNEPLSDNVATPFALALGQASFAVSTSDDANADFLNSGDLFVNATATGNEFAIAGAIGMVNVADAGGNGSSLVDNDGTVDVAANAFASEVGGGANATALAFALGGLQSASGSENATSQFDNDGSLLVSANAEAFGVDEPLAIAAGIGYIQSAQASDTALAVINNTSLTSFDVDVNAIAGGSTALGAPTAVSATAIGLGLGSLQIAGGNNATALFNNPGAANVDVLADAQGTENAFALGAGLGAIQIVNATHIANASIVNGGTFNVDVTADAFASGGAFPDATAIGVGIGGIQSANGETANSLLDNDGSFTVDTIAVAEAVGPDSDAQAFALSAGLAQIASGEEAGAVIDNGTAGIYAVGAFADATAEESANAAAVGLGYLQVATAENLATADFVNNGDFDVIGDAFASSTGVGGEAFALSGAIGGAQVAISTDETAEALFSNFSTYDVTSIAVANATNTFGDASAIAFGAGNIQAAIGDSALASMVNGQGGVYNVDVDAAAVADDDAFALGIGVGFAQVAAATGTGDNATVDLFNDGTMNTDVNATAAGGDDVTAIGAAIGGLQVGISPDDVADVGFSNSAEYTVSGGAAASATGTGNAIAVGAGIGLAQIGAGETAIMNFANGATDNTAANFVVNASAAAVAASGTAGAIAFGMGVAQIGIGGDDAFADLANDGTYDVNAIASASASSAAGAGAVAIGALQVAAGVDGIGDAAFVNNGDYSANATAFATSSGTAVAGAVVVGLGQVAAGGDVAIADFDNTGTFTFGADAEANGAGAAAIAGGIGIGQAAISEDDADAIMTNSNAIIGDFVATASASSGSAVAVGAGALQLAISEDNSFVSFANDGLVDVGAAAFATGATVGASAFLLGHAQIGVADLTSGTAAVELINGVDSTMLYTAEADAIAVTGASATAAVIGVAQLALAQNASASLTNSGLIEVAADAFASGTSAGAGALAIGGIQAALSPVAVDGNADVSFLNSGIYDVSANAESQGTGLGFSTASATAVGLVQIAVGSTATFENTADYIVEANATAGGSGVNNFAGAGAVGTVMIGADGAGDDGFNVDFLNTDDYTVTATAVAGERSSEIGSAVATAVGLLVAGTEVHGIVENTGIFTVQAEAVGTTSSAGALGIGIIAGSFDGTVLNSGVLEVTAIAENAAATGIAVATATGTAGGFVVNDGGTIIARTVSSVKAFESSEDFFHRGTAINVVNTNAAFSVDLLGGDNFGAIFGNILIGDNDEVNVAEGTTFLNGVVAGPGDLNILTGGELILVDDLYNGPSGAVVENFTQEDGSLLGLNIRPDSAPFIVADNVSLDGTVLILPEAGLYADVTVYEDVIDSANPIVGEWDNVASISPLLDPVFVDDGANNLDLVVERVAFGNVAGLSKNQENVGDGIENVYDDLFLPGASPAFVNLVSNLFTLTPGQYNDALNQLGGAEYAQQLQSALWSFRLLNNAVGERLRMVGPNDNCAVTDVPQQYSSADVPGGTITPTADLYVPAPAPAIVCAPNKAQVWVKATGQWSSDDGDSNGPKYNQDTYAIYGGVDWGIDPVWKVGLTGGYLNSKMDFKNANGNKIDYDGLQIAGYGAWDNGVNYAHGILGYGHYWNESHRNIGFGGGSVNPFPQKDDIVVGVNDDLKGKWQTDVLSIYGETGYRYWMTPTASLTPFLSLNYVKAWNDSFKESSNGSGAALKVKSNDGDSFNTQLGARVATQMDMGGATVAPELRVAWQHEWLDRYQTVDASFAAAPGSGFSVIGTKESRDFAVVGAGATFGLTEFLDFMVDYDGRFSSDHEDHSVVGRVTYKF
ncbi:uncharacterized protein with beta-barrel porin domain [Rhodoligotrophos appendicifer]|uniref:autotransporter outer membrane beta-barrel domain-containing protein n=1 Tax=Rhodoligotrophos appendicifer TaxID=987056 RepID=UPI001185E377|nr:autotransporter outer membrane beta-barrel domain-containing protein [Rhodoligotrophos appendicifer]